MATIQVHVHGHLALADLLMTSSQANVAGTPASEHDDHPETHAEGVLRCPVKKAAKQPAPAR